jgi:toxin ParE1/3/4
MKYKILSGAKKQLIKIWLYTEEKWGEEQANLYINGLYCSLEEMALSPKLWKKINYEKMNNVYYHRYKKHFIFFRLLNTNSIGVISILHEKMNLPERLKEDFDK